MVEVAEQVIQISEVTILDLHTISASSSIVCYADNQVSPTQLENSMKIIELNVKEGLPLEDITRSITNPMETWLPITSSRNGNAYYSAFHLFNSGIGFQVLMVPVAFTILGWTWGIICLSLMFGWQFYTMWLLVQLHESVPGMRYDRYIQLLKAAFGEKMGKLLGIFPLGYLSGGTCVLLIITAGESMKLFMKIRHESTNKAHELPLTTIECYLLFVCLAVVLSQVLPNLNSVAWISFIGALAAVFYCTVIWVMSISKNKPDSTSYDQIKPKSDLDITFSAFNALGIISLAFRGHNLILEIQATVPSSPKHPSRTTMWKGVKFAYLLIAICLFPLGIGGYWAYGNKIATAGGMMNALHTFHRHDTSRFVLKLTTLMLVIHCLCSYQIYAMPTIDNLEFAYTSKNKKACPKWIRSGFRVFFGCLTFFIAVAIPFIKGLAGIVGGMALPLTLSYPCLVWIIIKKPQPYSAMWCANMVLGSLGMLLSVSVFAGGIYSLVHPGIDVRFFKP